jgi:hypothetical protein
VAQRPDLRQYVAMSDSWHAPGGWRIEIVELSGTPNRRDGQWYRIRQHGFWTADVRSIAEIERYVPLAELEEAEGGLASCPGACSHPFAPLVWQPVQHGRR